MKTLNERIAESKGICLHRFNNNVGASKTCAVCGEVFPWKFENPDWENNIADAWELFEELPIKKDLVQDTHGWWVWWEYGKSIKCPQKAETAQEAICKAYLAYKENK